MNRLIPAVTCQIAWVYTHDIDSSTDFYARVLALECCRDEGRARIYRVAENACIGVCEAFAGRIVEPKGGMISLVTDDVDTWYRRLLELGADIEHPPRRLEEFGIYTFFVRDPNGYVIEFQQFD